MRNVYECEKCGKRFYDFDECYSHEQSHWTITNSFWKEYEKACAEMIRYSEKSEAPSEVGVEIERYDEETCKTVHAVGRYKLVEIFFADELVSDEERAKKAEQEEIERAEAEERPAI